MCIHQLKQYWSKKIGVKLNLIIGLLCLSSLFSPLSANTLNSVESKKDISVGSGNDISVGPKNDISVGPQYDTTHVYVSPEDFDGFVKSFTTTFGGKTTKQGVFQVTPTPSQTISQLILTPSGTVSVFGFKTPIPYPFGSERTGYLVKNLDEAVVAARLGGADIIVTPFSDPIGRDVIIQWPGGINMQLYWHTKAPLYEPLKTIPENRIYISEERADIFIQAFIQFSKGKIESDEKGADGKEIGRPGENYRRVRIASGFGKMLVMVTNGQLPWPYGRELTGYEVSDIHETLVRAKEAGVIVLIEPFTSDNRISTIVKFPGGYIAEIHEILNSKTDVIKYSTSKENTNANKNANTNTNAIENVSANENANKNPNVNISLKSKLNEF